VNLEKIDTTQTEHSVNDTAGSITEREAAFAVKQAEDLIMKIYAV
jgi:hypothetical protein